eukprot:3740739-Ditylum_brightwellii.AAC.1
MEARLLQSSYAWVFCCSMNVGLPDHPDFCLFLVLLELRNASSDTAPPVTDNKVAGALVLDLHFLFPGLHNHVHDDYLDHHDSYCFERQAAYPFS